MNIRLLGRAIFLTIILIVVQLNVSYAQLYLKFNLGSGLCSYQLKNEWIDADYIIMDKNYLKPHFICGIGSRLTLNKNINLVFNFNYSKRKFNIKSLGGEQFWPYDKNNVNLLDYYLQLSYNVLKFIDIGVLYQRSLFTHIKYSSSENKISDYKPKIIYANNLFGYSLNFKHSNFNLSFQYLPYSEICGFRSNDPKDLFPFRKSRNIQLLFSYDLKLCNIKIPRKNSKLSCPSFDL